MLINVYKILCENFGQLMRNLQKTHSVCFILSMFRQLLCGTFKKLFSMHQ